MDYLQARKNCKSFTEWEPRWQTVSVSLLSIRWRLFLWTPYRQALEKHYPQGFPFARYKDCSGVMQQYIFYRELLQ